MKIWRISLLLLVIGLDQISKTAVISHLRNVPELYIAVTEFFSLAYSWNYGISFGLFGQYYQYSNYAFIAINSLILLYILKLCWQASYRLEVAGYTLVSAGAMSNLIDRICRGGVFDFISFNYGQYYLPIFNLADVAISLGVAMIIGAHYLSRKPRIAARA